jgi:hypothetical protein
MARDDDDEKNKQAVYGVDVDISVVLGQASLRVNQLLKLGRGAVVELEQRTSDFRQRSADCARRSGHHLGRQDRRDADRAGQIHLQPRRLILSPR